MSQRRDTSLLSENADSAILHYAVFEKEQGLLQMTEDKCRRDALWGIWFVLWFSYQLEGLTAALIHLYKSCQ